MYLFFPHSSLLVSFICVFIWGTLDWLITCSRFFHLFYIYIVFISKACGSGSNTSSSNTSVAPDVVKQTLPAHTAASESDLRWCRLLSQVTSVVRVFSVECGIKMDFLKKATWKMDFNCKHTWRTSLWKNRWKITYIIAKVFMRRVANTKMG